MLIIFCSNPAVYHYVKKCFPFTFPTDYDLPSVSFKGYSSKDISILERLNIHAPFPFDVALPTDTDTPDVILMTPNIHLLNFNLCELGVMQYVFPHAHILHVSVISDQDALPFQSVQTASQNALSVSNATLYIPFSIVNDDFFEIEMNHSTHTRGRSDRAIYFDMMFDFSDDVQFCNTQYDRSAYGFFLYASRLWQSHMLFSFLIPSHIFGATDVSTITSSYATLRKNIDILRQNAIPSSSHTLMVKWLLEMKKLCRLTSTECKQLYTLLQGYVQNHPNGLDDDLQGMILKRANTKTERKIIFNECKQMLMEALH